MPRSTSLGDLARLILTVWGLRLINMGAARARRRNDPDALARWVRVGHRVCDVFEPVANRAARAAGVSAAETPGGCASRPDHGRPHH